MMFLQVFTCYPFSVLWAQSQETVVIRNTDLPEKLEFPFFTKNFLDKTIKNDNILIFNVFSRNMKSFKLKSSRGIWDECLAELGEIYKDVKEKLDDRLCCDKRQYIASPITVQKRVGGDCMTGLFWKDAQNLISCAL